MATVFTVFSQDDDFYSTAALVAVHVTAEGAEAAALAEARAFVDRDAETLSVAELTIEREEREGEVVGFSVFEDPTRPPVMSYWVTETELGR